MANQLTRSQESYQLYLKVLKENPTLLKRQIHQMCKEQMPDYSESGALYEQSKSKGAKFLQRAPKKTALQKIAPEPARLAPPQPTASPYEKVMAYQNRMPNSQNLFLIIGPPELIKEMIT